MLQLVSKEEYKNIIDDLNKTKLETRFKPEITERRNHKDFVFLKMVSEDGNNTLQGIASAEIYETRSGNIATINTLWVRPECRGNSWGELLIFHLMNFVKEKFEIYSFMCSSNKEALKSFLNNGFNGDIESGKNTVRLIKAE